MNKYTCLKTILFASTINQKDDVTSAHTPVPKHTRITEDANTRALPGDAVQATLQTSLKLCPGALYFARSIGGVARTGILAALLPVAATTPHYVVSLPVGTTLRGCLADHFKLPSFVCNEDRVDNDDTAIKTALTPCLTILSSG